MPLYVYRLEDTDELIEVFQHMRDAPLDAVEDPESGKKRPVKKVFQAPGLSGLAQYDGPVYKPSKSELWNSAQRE